ncbi:MAG: hypothetical protein WCH01_08845 [Methylococcaceae bacterium]
MTLEADVLNYDKSSNNVLSRQLLLNIARARYRDPIHFTGIANIAATYNFQMSAGMTPALTGESGGLLAPTFGIGAAENPTISIVPIEGEEFTKRLLTPFTADKLTLMLRQHHDIDLLLRLAVSELRMPRQGKDVAFLNDPSDMVGYPQFRRVVLHLSTIQDSNDLYIEPLIFRRTWTLPAETMTPEGLQALEHDEVTVKFDEGKHLYRLSARVTGRIVITNYDPELLADEEKIRMNEAAMKGPPNEIGIDIRAGYTGGEYPLTGKLRLRSFFSVLNFLGKTIDYAPEYFVEKDPRTAEVAQNPSRTLEIVEDDDKPEGADLAVYYKGNYYAVAPDKGYLWNASGFQLLHQIFQMAVSELPKSLGPSITIAK